MFLDKKAVFWVSYFYSLKIRMFVKTDPGSHILYLRFLHRKQEVEDGMRLTYTHLGLLQARAGTESPLAARLLHSPRLSSQTLTCFVGESDSRVSYILSRRRGRSLRHKQYANK